MSYAQHRYLLMTLDPTHIGAGGYRLGRVDNSIIREPGTNLPKIPGTSLSGAIHTKFRLVCSGAMTRRCFIPGN
ncbi:MAG: RAMP superfamily CRISPR-associated protein [Blastocatellia bacterium]